MTSIVDTKTRSLIDGGFMICADLPLEAVFLDGG